MCLSVRQRTRRWGAECLHFAPLRLARIVSTARTAWSGARAVLVLTGNNRRHRNYGAVGEKINQALDLTLIGRADNPRESAGEVLRKLGFERPTNPQFKEANAILRELLGPAKKVQGVYKWYVPWASIEPRASDLLPRQGADWDKEF